MKPDDNPLIECKNCGERHTWTDYWEARTTIERPHALEQRCDECLEKFDRTHTRLTQNRSILGFTEGDK
jgi:hypothetical protein